MSKPANSNSSLYFRDIAEIRIVPIIPLPEEFVSFKLKVANEKDRSLEVYNAMSDQLILLASVCVGSLAAQLPTLAKP